MSVSRIKTAFTRQEGRWVIGMLCYDWQAVPSDILQSGAPLNTSAAVGLVPLTVNGAIGGDGSLLVSAQPCFAFSTPAVVHPVAAREPQIADTRICVFLVRQDACDFGVCVWKGGGG